MSEECNDEVRDRAMGSLLGLAVGDALGTTLEFCEPGTFEPISDLIGGGPFDLEPGQWTDDTSMMLCLAQSLVSKKTFNPTQQMNLYVKWWRYGHWSSTGSCFDIGNTVREALRKFQRSKDPFAGSADPLKAGNGSLMRLAPVPVFYHSCPEDAQYFAGLMSETTHAAPACIQSCQLATRIMLRYLNGAEKEAGLSDLGKGMALEPELTSIAQGGYREKSPPDIKGTGYVVDCLEAALWAFATTDNFREGALRAVNLGHDADTTGAVYGQIAGSYYGRSGIPENWVQRLARLEEIEQLFVQLITVSNDIASSRAG